MRPDYRHTFSVPAARVPSPDDRLVDSVTAWCEAQRGSGNVEAALEALIVGLNAEAGMLVRTQADAAPTAIAICDRQSGRTRAPLTRSYADCCFGPFIRVPRAASAWIASQDGEYRHQRNSDRLHLQQWQSARRMQDFVVLVIGTSTGTRDHLELHFSRFLSAEEKERLEQLCPTMARAWATRQLRVVSKCEVRPAAKTEPDVSLLTMANPARLTRAEFRICHLLSQGKTACEIARDLGRSQATIRSHLRSIYAKTSSENLSELTELLLIPAESSEYGAQSA